LNFARGNFGLQTEDARQHEFGDRGRRADQQRTADLARHLRQADVHLGRQAEDALGIGQHQFAGGGQGDAAVAAVEQAGVEMLLQLLDLEGHGRLGHE